jgi:flagellar motor protein MotB
MNKNSPNAKITCAVDTDGLENALVIPPYSEPHIEQNINATKTLNDIFTMDFDFQPGSLENNVAIEFLLAEKVADCRSAFIDISHYGMLHYSTNFPRITESKISYPGYFQQGVYHHFSLSFFKGSLNCYIDQFHVLSLPACGFNPIKYSLGFKGPLHFRNFRVATGKETNLFYKLTPAKSFVTHVFSFADDKSTIMPESMRYIHHLARYLKENPSMTLEINVHNDNDGDPAIIKRLTQVRAEEIKKQLVLAGIDLKRLTTKGWGDTKPIKPNDTPEGRYENRRVELIKQ